jgi:hypothetical protein
MRLARASRCVRRIMPLPHDHVAISPRDAMMPCRRVAARSIRTKPEDDAATRADPRRHHRTPHDQEMLQL